MDGFLLGAHAIYMQPSKWHFKSEKIFDTCLYPWFSRFFFRLWAAVDPKQFLVATGLESCIRHKQIQLNPTCSIYRNFTSISPNPHWNLGKFIPAPEKNDHGAIRPTRGSMLIDYRIQLIGALLQYTGASAIFEEQVQHCHLKKKEKPWILNGNTGNPMEWHDEKLHGFPSSL